MYDSQAFDRQQFGGISRYFAELIDALRKYKLARARPCFVLTDNTHLREKHLFEVWSVPLWWRWRYKEYYKNRLNALTTKWALSHEIPDLFHMTYYDRSLLEQIRCPVVVTVHDMIPELFPELFEKPKLVHADKLELCRRADAIICVSHRTQSDLVRLYGVDPKKTFVTYSGIDQNWAKGKRSIAGLPGRYLLFVGSRASYKNFSAVAQSLARLVRRRNDLHLVCVGGGAFAKEEIEALNQLSVRDRVHHMILNDSELAFCYSKAAAFVFPSLYEGFGFPILEGFLSGCPVILSNRSCFPEIAQEAAQYFDPSSAESLDEAIESVLGDKSLAAQFIDRGFKHVKRYTWLKTATETARVYRSVFNHEY